ncbi:MAG: hypothetical protein CMM75_10135 [Rhodospirillaceae bacterium]|nr:hypothetical protein [Rhodospirillaceae bacterium]MQF86548.1 hypothetical protein [SAR202 cluster bacterium]
MNTYIWAFDKLENGSILEDTAHLEEQAFTSRSSEKYDYERTVVREFGQNADDAQDPDLDQPVLVTITIGDFNPVGNDIQLFNGLTEHLNALGDYKNISEKITANTSSRFLTIEDTGTIGLVGDRTLKGQDRIDKTNPFNAFWRASGQSSKSKASPQRGSNGVGKSSFYMLSEASLYFAASAPKDDHDELLWGTANLPPHVVDDTVYKAGNAKFHSLVTCLTNNDPDDADFIKSFRNTFKLQRKANEHGLSLVVPYLREEIAMENIRKCIFSEWFHAIISGSLVFKLIDLTSTRDDEEINAQNFFEKVDDPLHRAYGEICKKVIGEGAIAIDVGREYSSVIKNFKSKPVNLGLSEAEIIDFQESYDQGDILVFEPKYWMKILDENGKPGPPTRVSFKVAYQKDNEGLYPEKDEDRRIFVRNDLLIKPNQLKVSSSGIVYVHLTNPALSELFRKTEGASHESFLPPRRTANTRFSITKYAESAQVIFYSVFDICEALLSKLNQIHAEKLKSSHFQDAFSIPTLIKNTDPDTPPGTTVNTPKGKGPQKATSYFVSSPMENGFTVHLGNTYKIPPEGKRFVTRVGYKLANTASSRSIDRWNERDFDFSDQHLLPISEIEDIELIGRNGNRVEFEITGEEPRFSIVGFDGIRDIVVDTSPLVEGG